MFTGLGATGTRRQAPRMRPPLQASDRWTRQIDRSRSLHPVVFWPVFLRSALDRSDNDRYRRSRR